jgi:hypothetical protein
MSPNLGVKLPYLFRFEAVDDARRSAIPSYSVSISHGRENSARMIIHDLLMTSG